MTLVFPVLSICWMLILSKVTLIAIGNRNRGDDGIALTLIERVKEELPSNVDVQIWENKDALSVAAELLEIKTAVVIIDSAEMGIEGGEFRWFKQSECYLKQHLGSLSTHGFGFSDALALAEVLGFKQELYFFAIQPVQIDFDCNMSETLEKNKQSLANSLIVHLECLCAINY